MSAITRVADHWRGAWRRCECEAAHVCHVRSASLSRGDSKTFASGRNRAIHVIRNWTIFVHKRPLSLQMREPVSVDGLFGFCSLKRAVILSEPSPERFFRGPQRAIFALSGRSSGVVSEESAVVSVLRSFAVRDLLNPHNQATDRFLASK